MFRALPAWLLEPPSTGCYMSCQVRCIFSTSALSVNSVQLRDSWQRKLRKATSPACPTSDEKCLYMEMQWQRGLAAGVRPVARLRRGESSSTRLCIIPHHVACNTCRGGATNTLARCPQLGSTRFDQSPSPLITNEATRMREVWRLCEGEHRRHVAAHVTTALYRARRHARGLLERSPVHEHPQAQTAIENIHSRLKS